MAQSFDTGLGAADRIPGFTYALLLDSTTGLLIAFEGRSEHSPDDLAAFSSQIVRTQIKAIDELGLEDDLEEMLFTLGRHLHILQPLPTMPAVIIHVVLDRAKVNLGIARLRLREVVNQIRIP